MTRPAMDAASPAALAARLNAGRPRESAAPAWLPDEADAPLVAPPRDGRPVAERLADGPLACLLARIAGEHVVLPLSDVLEAVDAPGYASATAEGDAARPGRRRRLLPWRGRALPVHDAGLVLGAGAASAAVALVLADADGRPMAFAADDAVDILQVTRDDVRRVPPAASADGLVLGAVATAAGLAAVVEPAVLCHVARAAAPTPTASDDSAA